MEREDPVEGAQLEDAAHAGHAGHAGSAEGEALRGDGDAEPPQLEVLFPVQHSWTPSLTDEVAVHGVASDNIGVSAVVVAGVEAESSDGFQTWSARVPWQALSETTGEIRISAFDAFGNESTAQVATTQQDFERP